MKSVLLGGLRVWLVNDGGKPLSAPGGRAKFFKAGTSTPETVYSDIDLTQATALGPVVYTDNLGYLPPIWLKTDRLYKVRIEQKIPGTPEQWALLWEVDNVGYIDPHESEEPGEPIIAVNSISDLKTVDHSAHTVVMVLGYYSAGDWGEPSIFVFDPECTKAPEDGAYVLPNDMEQAESGRWVQQFSGDVLDVRKFGALPDLTENSDCCAKVINAVTYSQSMATVGKIPMSIGFLAPGKYDFVGGFDFSDYHWTDLSDNTRNDIRWIILNDVVLNGVSVNNLATKFKLDKDTDCRAIGELVGGNTLLEIEGGGSIKVDPAWWGIRSCYVEDCYVKCSSVTTNDKSFSRCVVESNRMLDGNVSLEEMKFKEEWFKDGFAYSNLSLQDVEYSVYDCLTANSYVNIKNSQNDPKYGDLGEQTVSAVTLIDGAVAENAYFENVVIQGDCELHNVSGSVTEYGSSLALNAVDCWLNVLNPCIVESMAIRRGSLSGADIQVISNLYLDNVEISASITTFGATASILNSTIEADVYSTDIKLERDVIKAGIRQRNVGTEIHPDVSYCRFYGPDGKHYLSSTTENSVVNGKWVFNDASGGDLYRPVYIDMTNIEGVDSLHTYTYEHNTGRFLPRRPSKYRITNNDTRTFERPAHISGMAAMYPDEVPVVSLILEGKVYANTSIPMVAGIYIKDGYSVVMPFFSIGSVFVTVKTHVTINFTGAEISGESVVDPFATAFSNSKISAGMVRDVVLVNDAANFNVGSIIGNKLFGPAYTGFTSWTTPGFARGGDHAEGNPGSSVLTVEVF